MLLALAFGPGCKQLTPTQSQTLDHAATILRGTARSGALLAISKNSNNCELVELSVTALDQLVVGTNFSSQAVQEALAPVWKHSQDPIVTLALTSTLDLYDLFLGEWAKSQVTSNQVAFTLLSAMKTGGQQALSGSVCAK